MKNLFREIVKVVNECEIVRSLNYLREKNWEKYQLEEQNLLKG